MNFFRTTDATDTTIWKPGLSKKFIGQIQLYGNLPYNCSIQQKRQIQLVVRDRMNSIGPMNFFRTTDTTDTTDTTIWKPGYSCKI